MNRSGLKSTYCWLSG